MAKSLSSQYDNAIRRSERATLAAIKELRGQMMSAHCRFGENVIPFFIKPFFLSASDTAVLKAILQHILRMLEKVIKAYFEQPDLRPLFCLPDDVHKYMQVDPGYKNNIVIARPDAFYLRGHYQFIEFNCDSPAGAGYSDIQQKLLEKTFLMKSFSKNFIFDRARRLDYLLRALVECYHEFGGRKKHPTIAIVDWKNIKTHAEFTIVRRHFESKGYPSLIADPRELKLKAGRLRKGDRAIDLVYRRVIFNELWAKKGEAADFLKAYRRQKVCVANPFRSRLAANKAILAILTNPIYNYLFTPEEIAIKEKYLPWTRRVVDAQKFYGKKKVYLKQMIDENKDALVLKPSDGYGGNNVKIGRETSRAHWRETIRRALRSGEHWVVQEYVDIPKMSAPIESRSKIVFRYKKVNFNPYLFNGHYAGAVARLSDNSVINVSAGGGLVPVITYRGRSADGH